MQSTSMQRLELQRRNRDMAAKHKLTDGRGNLWDERDGTAYQLSVMFLAVANKHAQYADLNERRLEYCSCPECSWRKRRDNVG